MARKDNKPGSRIEPSMGRDGRERDDGALRATRDDRVVPTKGKARTARAAPGGKRRRPKRSLLRRLTYWVFVMGIWGVLGFGGLLLFYGSRLPPIDQLAVPKRPPNIAILGSDGTLLANRGDSGGAAVRISQLPAYLPAAFVAIEDRRFYSDFGIDPIGIARALFHDLSGHGGLQGGSTLTQQLAKNLFLTQERTLSRKIQEMILALWLEHKYSKDQILELYLNRMYFGSGAYGVEAAAHKYFGVDARQVTLPEAAMLAGLMKAPTRLAPNHNPSAAETRANVVITAMAAQGKITQSQAQVALANPAHAIKDVNGGQINYVADYVMDALSDQLGAIDHDIVVDTTINPALQRVADTALTGELDKFGTKDHVSQGAMVAMDMQGDVLSLVGGRSYQQSQFNRAISAKRQPGSSFKPFVYLTALEGGLTPDSIRNDAPIDVRGWKPEDYERHYEGPVTLRHALAHSINTVAVRLGLEYGPRNVINTAHRLGILSQLQPNASIALGTSEVSPFEMVSAYVPFANGGIAVLPHIIRDVHTTDGRVLYRFKNWSLGRVISPEHVAMMNDMMLRVVQSGTATRAHVTGWQVAGKTGTSQNFRDAWFIGYTGRVVAGVWLGNDDNSPTRHVVGGSLPADIFRTYMTAAVARLSPVALPTGAWGSTRAPVTPGFDPRPPANPNAPMTINQAAAVAQNQRNIQPPIPTHDRNLLERLLGR